MQRGDPIKLNFEGLEMPKWNVPADRVQIVDKKGVICLVIMFTQEDYSAALTCSAQSSTNFLLLSAENT